MKTILFLLAFSYQVWASCPNGQFDCLDGKESGRCIPKSWVCDNIPDCSNGKDERNCTYRRFCASDQLMCPDKCVSRDSKCDGSRDCVNGDDEVDCEGQDIGHLREFLNKTICAPPMYRCKMTKNCLPKASVCNRNKDCPLGDDEENCPNTKHVFCPEGHKLCRSRESCIVDSHICDGMKDCDDGSDEWECLFQPLTPWTSYCGSDEFRCAGSPVECIHSSRMCDGRKDCQFGDDEGVCHLCENLRCEHKCQFTKRTIDGDYVPSCQCPRGAVLQEDGRSCHIPDYCKTDEGKACQHFCREETKTAICYCAPGYNLTENGVSCVSQTESRTILLAVGPEISEIPLFPSNGTSERLTALEDTVFRENVAIDVLQDTILLGTYASNGSQDDGVLAIYRNGRLSILKENRSVVAVAADLYGQNIFFVVKAPSYRTGIHACALDGIFCKRIFQFDDLKDFGNLVLDPSRGYLYFTESDLNVTQIIRARMDGTNGTVIHENKSSSLNGLTIDSIRQELYFGDAANGNIVKIHLETLESAILLEHSDFYPLSMKFLDGFLYCVEWPHRVWAVDTRSPNVTRTVIHRAENIVSGLTFSRTLDTSSSANNPCASAHCTWLCVPTLSENNTLIASCLCPDDYHDLDEDNTCHPFNHPPPTFDLSQSYLKELCDSLTACVDEAHCWPTSRHGKRCVCPRSREGLRCELKNPFFEEHEEQSHSSTFWYFILSLITMTTGTLICIISLSTNCCTKSSKCLKVWKNRLCSVERTSNSVDYDIFVAELTSRASTYVSRTNRENILFRSESSQQLVRPDSIVTVQSTN